MRKPENFFSGFTFFVPKSGEAIAPEDKPTKLFLQYLRKHSADKNWSGVWEG
ncbi:hypothetical protein [[Leptolyngbya] sp. PCC 7376]|uniref:hypothetical protein n=1 Tax=[Leptolyngbya] sp. PCC 7376 TaxID=111781 RepID=UPI0002E55A3D|nr:hypothetical protein [[Leptolyngbya] sp. PCC 7376]